MNKLLKLLQISVILFPVVLSAAVEHSLPGATSTTTKNNSISSLPPQSELEQVLINIRKADADFHTIETKLITNNTAVNFTQECLQKPTEDIQQWLCYSFVDSIVRIAHTKPDINKFSSLDFNNQIAYETRTGKNFCANFIQILPDSSDVTETKDKVEQLHKKFQDDLEFCRFSCTTLKNFVFEVNTFCAAISANYKLEAKLKPAVDNTQVVSSKILENSKSDGDVLQLGAGENVKPGVVKPLVEKQTPQVAPVQHVSNNVPAVVQPAPGSAVQSPEAPAVATGQHVDNPVSHQSVQNVVKDPAQSKSNINQPNDEGVDDGGDGAPPVVNEDDLVDDTNINDKEDNEVEFNMEDTNISGTVEKESSKSGVVTKSTAQEPEIAAPKSVSTTASAPAVIPANDENSDYHIPNLENENESSMKIVQDPFLNDSGSNFFFYLILFMFICIAGYVLHHNKSKVLALFLEGRRSSHSGRGGFGKRKHTAAYRKLDSNLEEAITSNTSGRTTQIIY